MSSRNDVASKRCQSWPHRSTSRGAAVLAALAIVPWALALVSAAWAAAAAPAPVTHPELLPAPGAVADTAEETIRKDFSAAKAAEYLDRRAHLAENRCWACHSTFSYVPARLALDPQAAGLAETRAALEGFVGGFVDKPIPPDLAGQPRAMRILAAVALARQDAATSGHLQPLTRQALDHIWDHQRDDGGWNWSRAAEPPSAVDDFYGVAMVAVGVGAAPDGYAATPKAQVGLARLRGYFHQHPPADLHQRGLLLLADRAIGDVLTAEQRRAFVAACFARQLPDGGWSTAGLADWKRPDQQPLDAGTSDGLGTGFLTYALRQGGGVGTDDERLRLAVQWLQTHQRESGGWFTRSPRSKDLLASYAGTSWAILALAACGEIAPAARGPAAPAPAPAPGTKPPAY